MSLTPSPTEPLVHVDGPIAFHTQRCAVLSGKHAVLNLNIGVFEPSWEAQAGGWQLVRLDSWSKRVVYRLFFKRGQP